MTVVEELKRLSEARAKGVLSTGDFEKRRAALLNAVEPAEEAPPPRARSAERGGKPMFEPGVTLAFVALGSILPGLVAMLLFDLPLWTGATIFAATLGALTWLWARSLDGDDEGA